MNGLMTSSLWALPAAAQGMGMMPGYCHGGCHGILAGAAFAVVAVLGYWVLLQAVKETSTCIKRIGDVLGSVLVILGLLGLLCATVSHIKAAMGCCHRQCLTAPPAEGMAMPPGHPPVGGMIAPAPETKKGGKPK